MNYCSFWINYGKCEKKQRQLVTTERRKKLKKISESNYQTKKFFTEDLLAIKIEKIKILMNKPVSLGFSRLELIKILMYEFCYDYVEPK